MSDFFETSPRERTLSWSAEQEQETLEFLVAHYWDSYPKEAIGVITDDLEIIELKNRSRHRDRFLVMPWDMLKLGRGYWTGKGLQLIYHSHRQSTSPSQADMAFMGYIRNVWPGVDHLIFTPSGEYSVWTR